MKQEIRHRRLYAFYTSKVLNALMIVVILSLLLLAYAGSMLLPAICCALGLLFFIGYSLWLWIKKPKSIVINSLLSDLSGMLTIYYLTILAIKAENEWWYITPIALSVVLLFVVLITNSDEKFEI